jgi:hypothetical protein
MKPPNKMQTANVKGAETPLAASLTPKKYRRKMYTVLAMT